MFRRKNVSHSEEQNETERTEQKVKELREALGPLMGCHLQYCSDACLRRYLDARNGNLDKAKKMLEEMLNWRSTFRPEDILWCDVVMEGETGKLFRANFHDRHGRTVLILRPGMQDDVAKEGETGKLFRANFHDRNGRTVLILEIKQNSTSMEDNMKQLVYTCENAIFNLPDGQEKISWLIDFTGWSIYNVTLTTTKQFFKYITESLP